MLEVEYEQLVTDPAGQARSMLAFLELPWDEACRTEPAGSIGLWRRYQGHMGPLLRLRS